MNGYSAYKQAQNLPPTRVELILTIYRKAMDNLSRARQALTDERPEAARPLLLQTQLLITSMASELPGYKDELAVNFLRLYEFVAHQMSVGTIDAIDSAVRVLTPLMKGFEAVREQAVTLERQGKIPPLEQARLVSVKA